MSIHDLIEKGDNTGILELLDNEDVISKRDNEGRTVLDLSVLMGKSDITTMLLEKGGDANMANSSGYSTVHVAAVWGRLECLKLLVTAGAICNSQTRHKETVRDLAIRYGNKPCVDFIDYSEAKSELIQDITRTRETLTDTERISGKWNKDDRAKVTALCNEKNNWLEKNTETLANSVTAEHRDFSERMEPFMTKLAPT